ncbi:alpha/beta-hydrolase [Lactarius hatsudake]|nr:alpha/beta-hydrolase [Lactarius hatsudake]
MQSTQWKRLPSTHLPERLCYPCDGAWTRGYNRFLCTLPASRWNAWGTRSHHKQTRLSTPFSEGDRALLFSTTHDTPAASEHADHYMKARAGELYDFLTQLVKSEELPTNSIVLSGWSLGTAFVNSFLAYGPSFDSELWGSGLNHYIRRVIAYDGYYFPLNDPPISKENEVFPSWVTGHYADGDTLETLSLRDALDEPSPTITRMSHEDLASTFHEPPTLLDGSDTVIQKSGVDRGVFSRLREAALFAPQNAEIAWPNVEFRYVCCDRSVWLMPCGIWSFGAEIDQVRKDGKRIRNHSVVRMRGANHCSHLKAHWDEPERTLKLLLSDAPSDINIQDVAKL